MSGTEINTRQHKQQNKRTRDQKDPNLQNSIKKLRAKTKKPRVAKGKVVAKEDTGLDEEELTSLIEGAVLFEGEEFDNDVESLQRRVKHETDILKTKLGGSMEEIDKVTDALEQYAVPFSEHTISVSRAAHVMDQIEKLLTPRLICYQDDFINKEGKDLSTNAELAKHGFDELTIGQKNMLVGFFFTYSRKMAPSLMALKMQLTSLMKTLKASKSQTKALKENFTQMDQRLTSFASETIGNISKIRTTGSGRLGYNPGGFSASGLGVGIAK